MFELTVRAFNLSEKYRTPVILLGDEIIAHMREQITIPSVEDIEIINRRTPAAGEKTFFGADEVPPMPEVGEGFNVIVTGSTHDEYGIRVTADPTVHRKLVERLNNKIQNHADEMADFETRDIDDCQIGIVSHGCTSRTVYDTIEELAAKGIKTGHVRLKTLWPFPEKIVKKLADSVDKIVVPEMNLRQVFYEVERAARGSAEIIPLNKIGGGELITPEELTAKIQSLVKKND
jgi:2-oxoglutarate ferredoxin oxidoreductase subunit alpha